MPTTGWLSLREPADPQKLESPKLKTPPSDADDRAVEVQAAGGSVEVGVTEAEHPTVARSQLVAVGVSGGGDAHHWLIEAGATQRSVEEGVAEGEHPTVRRHHPVPP